MLLGILKHILTVCENAYYRVVLKFLYAKELFRWRFFQELQVQSESGNLIK